MDLTPRTSTQVEDAAAPVRTRRWVPLAVLVAVMLIGGFVVVKFLTSAIDYYCNVDEVGAKSGCNADRRLRVQGTVEQGSVRSHGSATDFVIAFNGSVLPVTYEGQPGGIFQECIPVVVHGQIRSADDGTRYLAGDQIEVKHSSEYVAANGDRLDAAENSPCSPQP